MWLLTLKFFSMKNLFLTLITLVFFSFTLIANSTVTVNTQTTKNGSFVQEQITSDVGGCCFLVRTYYLEGKVVARTYTPVDCETGQIRFECAQQ